MKASRTTSVICRQCPLGKHERILVATDGSRYSTRAVQQALNLAKLCGSALFALHVIEFNPELAALAPDLQEKMEKESRQLLKGIRDQAAKQEVPCETIVHQGEQPYELIIREANAKKADIIVIGSHGKTGLKKLLLGSVAAKVVGHTRCPVLVVPLKGPATPKRILAATDGSKPGEAAVKQAINMTTACGGTLTVLSAVVPHGPASYRKEAEKAVEKARKAAEKAGLEAETIVREGQPHEVIVETSREKKAGLIVMGSVGKTGLDRLLIGSVAERVIGHAPCAVLVVPKV